MGKRKRDEDVSESESEDVSRKKKKKRKKRQRSSTSESSSPEPVRKKKKKKKKEKKKKLETVVQKCKAFGVDPITSKDYFAKNAVFRSWLFEKKHMYFDKLTTKKAEKKFNRFIKKWNAGELPVKFYQHRTLQSLHSAERTNYKWSFEKNMNKADIMALQSARDSVDNYTNEQQLVDEVKVEFDKKRGERARKTAYREKKEAEEREFAERFGGGDDRVQRFEEKQLSIHEREARKKRWRKTNTMAMEELVPKKEGFDRRLEKRQMKHRQIENDSFGGGNFDHFGGKKDRGLEFHKRKRNDDYRDYRNKERKHYVREKNIAAHFNQHGI